MQGSPFTPHSDSVVAPKHPNIEPKYDSSEGRRGRHPLVGSPCPVGEAVQAEWDDRKGKYRAASWSVDTAAAAAVMLPGVLKKFFQDKGGALV